jgi:hypothetical protein
VVKRLNAPRAGQYNASAIERLVRDSTGDILPIDATDTDEIENLAAIATSGSASDLSAGTVPAARMPAHTGDVTSASGAVALTIANDAVTYAKMQNVSAASKMLGRGDSGSGDTQEITLGTGLSMSGTTLNGSSYSEPWTYVKRTANGTNATTTHATTGLSVAGSTFLANTYYEFEAHLVFEKTAGGAAVASVSILWPTVASAWVTAIGHSGSVNAGNNGGGTLTFNAGGTTSSGDPLIIRGRIYNNASAGSGTLDIQYAASAGGATITVWKGSFLKYRAYT